jgi:hypothetical protein
MSVRASTVFCAVYGGSSIVFAMLPVARLRVTGSAWLGAFCGALSPASVLTGH